MWHLFNVVLPDLETAVRFEPETKALSLSVYGGIWRGHLCSRCDAQALAGWTEAGAANNSATAKAKPKPASTTWTGFGQRIISDTAR